jgi:myo-inositol 2-dehydrogenase / D-chiro-inositol 1-dehydrogenase
MKNLNPHRHETATRRQFLKTSSVVATAATLGSLDISRFAYAAGNDTLRIGMIGCGGRCTGAAEEAMTADAGAHLVAMCDILPHRVQEKRAHLMKQKPNQVKVDDDHCFYGFDGYRKVIASADVVLIANAAKFHPMHAKAAIEAGKHVFVEKPHGIDPYGIKMFKAACDLAKEKKLSVVSGLHSRHHPGFAETVQRIQDGAIGEIISMEENFLRAPYGVVDRDKKLSELEYQASTQYHFVWLSGDDVVQSLVHNLDRASWAMKDQAPVKCHGMGGRSSMTDDLYGNVFDHHAVVYEFAGGVRIYAFCRTTVGCYDEYSSLVFGSKGKASIMGCRIWGPNAWEWKGKADPYQIEHNKLFAAIRSGQPINNGDYAARSTMIGIMGQISCYTGKEVTWDDINKSDFCYPPKPEDCHDGMEPPVKPGPDGSYPVYIPGKTQLI